MEAIADELFRAGELESRPFNIQHLLEAIHKTGHNVLAAPFTGRGNLRGVLFQVEGVPVIFYPCDPLLAMLTVAHEFSHIALGHRLHDRQRAEAINVYSDEQEKESEHFARYLVARWQLAALRHRHDGNVPESMTTFFRHL